MPLLSQIDLGWLALQFPDLRDLQTLPVGGQKQVFSAKHAKDGDVVLKIMHPGSDPVRTEREIAAASKVRAPRMPAIFQHGQIRDKAGSYVWFREKRILGEPLNRRINTRLLTPPELLCLALHVAETLVAAEDVNIVHRDVKPANIIMDPSDGFWLIDFGFARHLDLDSITATAAPWGPGTIGYAPIEQCRNVKPEIDARADVFALGVTIYEAATGTNPHRDGARNDLERINRVAKVALPRLKDPISSEFADLVTTLAQPNCVHRVQTAREAYEWIKDICDQEGVQ